MAEGAKTLRKIHPSRFKLATHVRNVWSIVPEDGTAYEEILEPSYWTHIAERLRPNDRIEVFAEDGSYFAELIVRSSTRLSAKVQELRKVQLGEVEGASPMSGFDVMWRGPHHKHAVIRLKDKVPLQTGFDTREAAVAWLAVNIRNLAA